MSTPTTNGHDETAEAARASLCTLSDWSVSDHSETPSSRDGVAWSCTIRRGGTAVGQAFNSGMGGPTDFDWTSPDHAEAFNAEEKARYGTQPEPGSILIEDLITLTQFAAVNQVIFFTDDDDVTWGRFQSLKPTVTLAEAKAFLTNPSGKYANKNPRIFDKSRGVFVPATDIEA